MGVGSCFGAAQPAFRNKLLTEMVQACSKEKLPLLVGGDFNIIRNPGEKIMVDLMEGGPFCSMLL